MLYHIERSLNVVLIKAIMVTTAPNQTDKNNLQFKSIIVHKENGVHKK